MRQQRTSSPDLKPPLKPVVFHVLLVLLDGERHGYSIVKAIEERTAGEMRIEPGNLYRTLRSLLEQGLIEECESRVDDAVDDQRRRYFRLTPDGVEAARVEAKRLERLVGAARQHNLLSP